MSRGSLRGRIGTIRLIALVAGVLVILAAIAGCGGGSSSTSGGGTTTSTGGGESSPEEGAATNEEGASTKTVSSSLPAWCGEKEITLGIQDGGGLNAWSAESKRQVEIEAKKCPNIKKTIVVDADFEPQKAVSGMQGMIAQGANAIVVIPDSGVCAELPTMREATARGIAVVPWGAKPCGEEGVDYDTYVDWNTEEVGEVEGEWLAKQMKGKGKMMYLGGPAGNPVDVGLITGLEKVLQKYPQIEILDNVSTKSWPVENWDPATARQVAATLLGKYPEVDGIFEDDGQSSAAVIEAFQADHRKIPPIATLEQNQLGCAWQELKGTPEEFPLATVSGRNWLGRYAVRKAVAAANELPEEGESIVDLPLFEDTAGGREPVCEKSAPPGRYNSNYILTEEEMNKLTGSEG